MKRANWWCLLKRALLLQTYYTALLLGILVLPFDFERRRFASVSLRRWRIYAFLLNALTIALIPATLPYTFTVYRFTGGNQLMHFINSVNLCVRFATLGISLLFRWRRERHVRAIVLQLLALEAEYFAAMPVQRSLQQRCDRLFYAKYFSVWVQLLTSIYYLLRFGELTLWWLLLYVYLAFTLYMLHCIAFHYFLVLWHIYTRFCMLNAQLEQLFGIMEQLQALPGHNRNSDTKNTMRQLQHALAAELRKLMRVHRHLTTIVLQLNECYKYAILLTVLTRVFNNIALGYYGIRLYGGDLTHRQQSQVSNTEFILGSVRYLLSMLDIFLVDVTCDAACAAHRRTAELLKRFHELPLMDTEFARSCDLLALQLKQYKLEINICGMFNLNRKNSMHIFSAIIKHVIWLMQYDIERTLCTEIERKI